MPRLRKTNMELERKSLKGDSSLSIGARRPHKYCKDPNSGSTAQDKGHSRNHGL